MMVTFFLCEKCKKPIGGSLRYGCICGREIEVLEAAIRYIRKGWGANCKKESKEWFTEGGCKSCFAKRVIDFLKINIAFAKEELAEELSV